MQKYLGAPRFFSEVAERTQEPGVATGLAWTPNGGEIMFIESTRMSGQKGLNLTGSLGDVMKESAQAALSYVRSSRGGARNRAGLLRQVRHPRSRPRRSDSRRTGRRAA